jgi:hypothetical protein
MTMITFFHNVVISATALEIHAAGDDDDDHD